MIMKYKAQKVPFKLKFWLIVTAVLIVFVMLFVFAWQWIELSSDNVIKEDLLYVSKNQDCYFKYFSSKCYLNVNGSISLMELQDKKDNIYVFKDKEGNQFNFIAVDKNVIYNDIYDVYLYC